MLLREGPVDCHGLQFDASFECGSAGQVAMRLDPVSDNVIISIEVLGECHGTPHVKSLGTWWYFSVSNAEKNDVLHFEMTGMANQKPLMNADHRPVYSHSESGPWHRVRYPCTFQCTGDAGGKPGFTLNFRHKVELSGGPIYFAFTYPYTLTQTAKFIAEIEARVGNRADAACEKPWPVPSLSSRGLSSRDFARSATGRSRSTGLRPKKHTTDAKRSNTSTSSHKSDCRAKQSGGLIDPSNFFFSREVLTRSPDGNDIELLTLTSFDGFCGEDLSSLLREPTIHPSLFPLAERSLSGERVGEASPSTASPASGSPGVGGRGGPDQQTQDDLYISNITSAMACVYTSRATSEASGLSDSDSEFGDECPPAGEVELPLGERRSVSALARPPEVRDALRPPSCLFTDKKVVVLSARVHPGETPGSYALEGMLGLLANPLDERAQELRRRFVFLIIPHLNPDGVLRGHWRMDHRGINLNRCYTDPKFEDEPSVFALKALFLHYHKRGSLFLYIDSHAHAGQRGCFLFGNCLEDNALQIQNLLYPRLVALHTPHLDLAACNFTEENMAHADGGDAGTTRESSARVALYKESALVHCYTLECNYNSGNSVNTIPAAVNDGGRATPPPTTGRYDFRCISTSCVAIIMETALCRPSTLPALPPKYTPEIWVGVGRACMLGTLELMNANPWTRIPRSEYRSLDGAKKAVSFQLSMNQRHKGPGKVTASAALSIRAPLPVRSSSFRTTPTPPSTASAEPIVDVCKHGIAARMPLKLPTIGSTSSPFVRATAKAEAQKPFIPRTFALSAFPPR